jgi:hypothetical protein
MSGFQGIAIAACASEKNLNYFLPLQTLNENGVEAKKRPSRPA